MKTPVYIAAAISLVASHAMASPAVDYGPEPSDYQQIVTSFYADRLVDPDSVQFRSIEPPRQAMVGNWIEGKQYGWVVCVTLNSKNRMGGYSGFSTDAVFIRNNRVVEVYERGMSYNDTLCPTS